MLGSNPRLKIARPSRRDQVDREPAPPGGEFVEHLAGLLDGGARDLLEPLAKPRRRQHLGLDQPRRLVFRPEQAQFDAFDRQAGAADDEPREFPRVLGDGGVRPLLAQFGHLRRLAGDHPGPRRVLAQDAALQDLRRTVGVAARQQRRPSSTAWAARRAPRTPAPERRTDPRPASSSSTSCASTAGGGSSSPGSCSTSMSASGWSRALPLQPVVEQLLLGRRRHRRQHQRVAGGGERREVVGG